MIVQCLHGSQGYKYIKCKMKRKIIFRSCYFPEKIEICFSFNEEIEQISVNLLWILLLKPKKFWHFPTFVFKVIFICNLCSENYYNLFFLNRNRQSVYLKSNKLVYLQWTIMYIVKKRCYTCFFFLIFIRKSKPNNIQEYRSRSGPFSKPKRKKR